MLPSLALLLPTDPGRMALAFPGVQKGGNDTENDIIIRGNSSFGVLWRLEGIDIPNPNHFARPGTSGGGITVFSAQWGEQVDPYLRYDGRIAWRKNHPKYTFNLSLDIQNITSRDNVNSVGYDPKKNALYFNAYDGSDFIPVLGMQWDF